jgi:hypothetical protein
MKKIILGLIAVVLVIVALNTLGVINLKEIFSGMEDTEKLVSPRDLVNGAKKFGDLRVVVMSLNGAVSNLEVDIGKKPGGKMSAGTTDADGIVVFNDVPVGDFVIFFNDYTYPAIFEKMPLIHFNILEDQTTEKVIELK